MKLQLLGKLRDRYPQKQQEQRGNSCSVKFMDKQGSRMARSVSVAVKVRPTLLNPSVLTTPCPKFRMLRPLGKGAFARVFEGESEGRPIAIKVYIKGKLNPQGVDNLLREISTLSQLDNEHVAKLHFVSEDTRHVTIGMTLAKGDTLKSMLRGGRLDESTSKWVMRGLLRAVAHMHDRGLAHRDIKLENVVVDRKQQKIVLIDYGFSLPIRPNRLFCGTPSYMSPEQVAREEYCPRQADQWSLGVTLFVMLMGTYPFRGLNELDLYRKIQKAKFDEKILPKGTQSLVRGLLAKNPADRISAQGALQNDWLRHD